MFKLCKSSVLSAVTQLYKGKISALCDCDYDPHPQLGDFVRHVAADAHRQWDGGNPPPALGLLAQITVSVMRASKARWAPAASSVGRYTRLARTSVISAARALASRGSMWEADGRCTFVRAFQLLTTRDKLKYEAAPHSSPAEVHAKLVANRAA